MAGEHEIGAGGAVLWGADQLELGEFELLPAGDAAAVALSRGAKPKAYWHVDPNEDAVAAIAGERATLLAAVDGHYGYESTQAAMDFILAELAGDPPADLGAAELWGFFRGMNNAVLALTQAPETTHRSSRAAVALALLSGERVQWASYGDCRVMLASPIGSRMLSLPGSLFVGHSDLERGVELTLDHGFAALEPGEWVVAATDGYTDYLPHGQGPAALAAALDEAIASEPADAAALARALIGQAFAGGAGDNVGVAVARR